VLDIVAADGKYGIAKFLHLLQIQGCGIVMRLRRDRVLNGVPEQSEKWEPGHPRVHGKRFAFKEPETWDIPYEVMTFEHPKLRDVKLERWNNLHDKNDADVPLDMIRASLRSCKGEISTII
jgi:hypothetical protein